MVDEVSKRFKYYKNTSSVTRVARDTFSHWRRLPLRVFYG